MTELESLMNQFLIKLLGSKRWVCVVTTDTSLDTFHKRIKFCADPHILLQVVGGKEIVVHKDAILAACGPNNPGIFEEVFPNG